MSKFKAGDKVVRINYSFGNMNAGDIGIVKYVSEINHNRTDIKLEGDCETYDSGNFKLVEVQPSNGVNAEGSPIFFDFKKDLKPFMRAVDDNNITYIVATSSDGELVALSAGTDWWYGGFHESNFKEVYEQPVNSYYLLRHQFNGKLLWKRKIAETEQQKAIRELEESIKASQEKLQALKGTM